MARGILLIAILIQDGEIRTRWTENLDSLCSTRHAATDWHVDGVKLETVTTLESLAKTLDIHFAKTPERFAIVISDMLVDRGEFDPNAKKLIETYFRHLFVTLAVNNLVGRVPDIDRVLPTTADVRQLADTLTLLMAQLKYLAPPAKRIPPTNIRVRRIGGEFELARYYRLRHEIFKIMGYMSEEKEAVTSGYEIDGCDKNAIHLGAFEDREGYQWLVGTSRIMMAGAKETPWSIWTENLLMSDNGLRTLVENEALPLGLPVFQSQNLNQHVGEAFEGNLSVAEISRVIVAYDYRGAGLARQLLRQAIDVARQAEIDRLYLECLPFHESLYASFGFRKIPGTGGPVIGVGKTMIAMMMEPTAVSQDTAPASTVE